MPRARELAFLLDEVCTRLGLCVRPEVRQLLEAAPPADVEAFALAMFRAEGLDPRTDRRLFEQVCVVAARTYDKDRREDA
jgi:hypothetical protein